MPTTKEMLTRAISAQAEQFDESFANDDPFDELWEAPLEVATRTQLVVVLCTGGPHIEAVADLDGEGAIITASLVGYWGNETVQQQVAPSSSLWRALCEYAETSRM